MKIIFVYIVITLMIVNCARTRNDRHPTKFLQCDRYHYNVYVDECTSRNNITFEYLKLCNKEAKEKHCKWIRRN